MHTITLQINNANALKTIKNLETKHFVRVVDNLEIDSPALPGKRLSITEFRNWIKNAEQTQTVPFKQAQEKWANKRKQIQALTK
ncbi:MAG: hypothetical protein K0Q79_3340 [Flavipsychrobacter sp.]|jgi:hypothetical protein|nr:hypothetical protein [Flavipsychrobacter sp.]